MHHSLLEFLAIIDGTTVAWRNTHKYLICRPALRPVAVYRDIRATLNAATRAVRLFATHLHGPRHPILLCHHQNLSRFPRRSRCLCSSSLLRLHHHHRRLCLLHDRRQAISRLTILPTTAARTTSRSLRDLASPLIRLVLTTVVNMCTVSARSGVSTNELTALITHATSTTDMWSLNRARAINTRDIRRETGADSVAAVVLATTIRGEGIEKPPT